MRHTKHKLAAISALPNGITDEMIALRAFEKWQQRGCPMWDGDADWFAAQEELERELGRRSE